MTTTVLTRRRALALLAAAAPAVAGAQASGPLEIAFGSDPAQRLDLYPRRGLSGAPMLLYVHGGAWSGGDKSVVDDLPAFAARHGLLLASANHRRGVGAGKAAQDVAGAAAWMLRHGPAHGGDARRLFLMGHSSGGHLVVLVGVDATYLAAHGHAPADLAGVISLDGAGYDAESQFRGRQPTNPMWRRAFAAGAAGLSPTRLVRPDGRYPPFLLFYTDHPGGRLYSEALAERLRGAGDAVVVEDAPGKTHAEINADIGRVGDPAGERAAAFIASGTP